MLKDNPNKVSKILNSGKLQDGVKITKPLIYAVYNELKPLNKIALSPEEERNFLYNIKLKNVRTESGVTPVTIMTKPYPCPGSCIYCPNESDMPKSYIANEPGAQRALANNFDPYKQTYNRLTAYKNNGHPTDKVEIIIIGGTWSFYPKKYKDWFIYRCFQALNDFGKTVTPDSTISKKIAYKSFKKVFKENETAQCRCVGLSIETRPDYINTKELINFRKLGITKVQLGVQSLDNRILKLANRGHTVKDTRNAFKLLRQFGFKIQIHWMPNLLGSTPEKDLQDYIRLFKDPGFKPDEVKIYPCSLIRGTVLEKYYKDGRWKPYSFDVLVKLLRSCLLKTPRYCRVSRVIRDISSEDIMAGNKKSNLRQQAEENLKGKRLVEIRSREIKNSTAETGRLKFRKTIYETSGGIEMFLEMVNDKDCIAGFLRLLLPKKPNTPPLEELRYSSIIREVHVYGQSTPLGTSIDGASQHTGIGRHLINKAIEISLEAGVNKVNVISSVGTKEYYRKLGFLNGILYQKKTYPC